MITYWQTTLVVEATAVEPDREEEAEVADEVEDEAADAEEHYRRHQQTQDCLLEEDVIYAGVPTSKRIILNS